MSSDYNKTKPPISERLCTRSRNRTGTAITGHWILSPARLPIPPSGHQVDSTTIKSLRCVSRCKFKQKTETLFHQGKHGIFHIAGRAHYLGKGPHFKLWPVQGKTIPTMQHGGQVALKNYFIRHGCRMALTNNG